MVALGHTECLRQERLPLDSRPFLVLHLSQRWMVGTATREGRSRFPAAPWGIWLSSGMPSPWILSPLQCPGQEIALLLQLWEEEWWGDEADQSLAGLAAGTLAPGAGQPPAETGVKSRADSTPSASAASRAGHQPQECWVPALMPGVSRLVHLCGSPVRSAQHTWLPHCAGALAWSPRGPGLAADAGAPEAGQRGRPGGVLFSHPASAAHRLPLPDRPVPVAPAHAVASLAVPAGRPSLCPCPGVT